ncbi:MAG TPA: 3-oxoacyl-[acyl-carrier-protein] synthase III C-terminal domain-containing protein [Vicinamibacterales bacterium]|nr:3-oxoacyl-[acyl-carrier-protein] synthase III C-terminal domain-containing protein [Vicinamibacterales bacterium]
MTTHIAAIEYALADHAVTLEELAEQGRLSSRPEALRSFGFDRAWVAGQERDQLATRAVGRLLENTGADPASIDVVLLAGATPASHATSESLLGGFSYPAARLQYDFGLTNARTIGVSQSGCLGLMTAVSLGRALLAADGTIARVLCVSSDVLPAGSTREILYNLISDGACALLLERGDGPNRLVAERQITKGYYWDCDARRNEIVAAYFPTARTIIMETLASSGLAGDDIALIVPHNVSLRSWEILLKLTGLPPDRLYSDNISAKAHVISGDNFINLKDASAQQRLTKGDRLLLFNFGFGASWACMIVEH